MSKNAEDFATEVLVTVKLLWPDKTSVVLGETTYKIANLLSGESGQGSIAERVKSLLVSRGAERAEKPK